MGLLNLAGNAAGVLAAVTLDALGTVSHALSSWTPSLVGESANRYERYEGYAHPADV